MAKFIPTVETDYAIRQCKVKGRNAFFHKWSEVSNVLMPSAMVGGHNGGEVKKTLGIIEYADDGTVHECYPNEIQFLDTKGKAVGYCWDDRTNDDYKTALVIGKTKQDAEKMVKNLGLVGFKTILTRGEGSLENLDGIRVSRVCIYADCGHHAKNVAKTIVASEIDGEVWVINREIKSEVETEST